MTVVDRKRLSVVTGAAGVTVNGVAPAYVHTEMIRHVMENPEFRNRLMERIPLGRIADPRDVVGPVMFFCSGAGA